MILDRLEENIPTLLLSAAVCFTIHSVVQVITEKYTSDPNVRMTYPMRVVSQLHAFLVTVVSINFLSNPLLVSPFSTTSTPFDRLFSFNPLYETLYAATAGYFVYDSLITLRHIRENGVGFFLHGICCLACYVFAFKPVLMSYGTSFLLFEVSTLFLNGAWFLERHKIKGWLHVLNGTLFIVSFFVVRIVLGFYASFLVWQDVMSVSNAMPSFYDHFPWPLLLMYGTCNVVLMTLNVVWLRWAWRGYCKRLKRLKSE